jgi:hypothetical protein
MAQGDFKVFDDAVDDLLNKIHDMDTDDIRLGLITSATTPTRTTANPTWGAAGTNMSTNETTGGAIAAGGIVLTTEAINSVTNGANFDTDDISVAVNASNPTAVRWGILYNNTATNKDCLGYLDFGSDTTLVNGLTVTINASGWFDITSSGA